MKKVNHGGTRADYQGSARQHVRMKLSVAWLKTNKPEVWKAIVAEAAKAVPYIYKSFEADVDISMLPK